MGKTYTYEVVESGSGDGVTNDSATHVVKVSITDNKDGTLTVEKTYDDGVCLEFHNTYGTETTFKFNGMKTLKGRPFQTGDRWTFTLTGEGDAPMPEGSVSNKKTVVLTAANGNQTPVEEGRCLGRSLLYLYPG